MKRLSKEAEKHKDSEDKDELDAAIKALNDAIMPIGAKMYQQSADDKKADEAGDKKSDKDEPVEGEIVDEKINLMSLQRRLLDKKEWPFLDLALLH